MMPWNSAFFPKPPAGPHLRRRLGPRYCRDRARRPARLQRGLDQRASIAGRAHHLQGGRADAADQARLGGAADRLLPSAADRDRGQCLRSAHPWALSARRRLRLLSHADGAARSRFRQDARDDARLDRADPQTVEQQGAGRLRRPVLDRQRHGGEAGPGAEAAPAGRHRLQPLAVLGRACGQIRPPAADRRFHSGASA